jgi:hypothetical protein
MGTRSSFVSRVPVRIQVEGDERYIEIKPKLGQGDRLMLIDSLLETRAIEGKAGVVSVAKYGAFVNVLLALSITGWHLTDAAGADVPFAVALIADLDPDDPLTEKVTQEVVARNPLGVMKTSGAPA